MYQTQYMKIGGEEKTLDNLQDERTPSSGTTLNGCSRGGERSLRTNNGIRSYKNGPPLAIQKKRGRNVEYPGSGMRSGYSQVPKRVPIDIESGSTIVSKNQGLNQHKKRPRKNVRKKAKHTEQPKVLLSHNRWTAVNHFLLLHAAPLTTALALIIINIQTHYYGVGGKWVGALQYVAKVHEMLMQVSLVTVLVAFLQFFLVHQDFVPLGAIFSGYQVTSLSYLWSSEFYAALSTPEFTGSIYIAFLFIVPFTVILAAAVGPSSAIAMAPRQVNFSLPDSQISLNATYEELFPTAFDAAGPPLDSKDAQTNEQSPAAGWQYLSNLQSVGSDPDSRNMSDKTFVYVNSYTGMSLNLVGSQGALVGLQQSGERVQTMPPIYSAPMMTSGGDDDGPIGAIRTMYVQYAPNSTIATTQSVAISLALRSGNDNSSLWWPASDLSVTARTKQPQPYTSVYCQPNGIFGEDDSRPFQFPVTYIADCRTQQSTGCSISNTVNTTDFSGPTRGQIFSKWKFSPRGQIIWIDNVTISSPLAAIVIQPELCNNQYLMTSACVIGAQWANTTSYLQHPSSREPSATSAYFYGDEYDGIASSSLSSESPTTLPNWSRPSIPLSVAWATSLDQVTDVENRTVSDNLLRLMPITNNLCPHNATFVSPVIERPFMHERLLATLVVNGMAHAGSSSQVCFPGGPSGWQCPSPENDFDIEEGFPQGPPIPAPPGVILTFYCDLPGYAWNLDGVPIKIALAILIIYCVYISGFLVYTLISGRSSMTWRNLSHLTALAVNSRPTRVLKNTSCGIDRTETFRNLVIVREREDSRQLELVFKKDEGKRGQKYKRVVDGKAY